MKWLDTDIDIVEIDGELYALDGWNGEKYTDCWKCIDKYTAVDDGRTYEIVPVYDMFKWNDDVEDFLDEDGMSVDGIIGHEVL